MGEFSREPFIYTNFGSIYTIFDLGVRHTGYGQDKNRDTKAIPYGVAARLVQKIEDWVRDACINDVS